MLAREAFPGAAFDEDFTSPLTGHRQDTDGNWNDEQSLASCEELDRHSEERARLSGHAPSSRMGRGFRSLPGIKQSLARREPRTLLLRYNCDYARHRRSEIPVRILNPAVWPGGFRLVGGIQG